MTSAERAPRVSIPSRSALKKSERYLFPAGREKSLVVSPQLKTAK